MSAEHEVKTTSLEELRGYANGQLVELPPFAEGQPFIARLRRPSMLVLAKNGCIPNELLLSANALFEGGAANSFDVPDKDTMTKLLSVMEIICDAAMVEPTYAQLKEAGVNLTDEQFLFIFGYSQNGVRQLKSFRK